MRNNKCLVLSKLKDDYPDGSVQQTNWRVRLWLHCNELLTARQTGLVRAGGRVSCLHFDNSSPLESIAIHANPSHANISHRQWSHVGQCHLTSRSGWEAQML